MKKLFTYLLMCMLLSSPYIMAGSDVSNNNTQRANRYAICGKTVAISTVAALALCGSAYAASKSKNPRINKIYKRLSKQFEALAYTCAEKWYEFEYWFKELFKKQSSEQQ